MREVSETGDDSKFCAVYVCVREKERETITNNFTGVNSADYGGPHGTRTGRQIGGATARLNPVSTRRHLLMESRSRFRPSNCCGMRWDRGFYPAAKVN